MAFTKKRCTKLRYPQWTLPLVYFVWYSVLLFWGKQLQAPLAKPLNLGSASTYGTLTWQHREWPKKHREWKLGSTSTHGRSKMIGIEHIFTNTAPQHNVWITAFQAQAISRRIPSPASQHGGSSRTEAGLLLERHDKPNALNTPRKKMAVPNGLWRSSTEIPLDFHSLYRLYPTIIPVISPQYHHYHTIFPPFSYHFPTIILPFSPLFKQHHRWFQRVAPPGRRAKGSRCPSRSPALRWKKL